MNETNEGSVVQYVDQKGRRHQALVTQVWGERQWTEENPPSLNLVILNPDPEMVDQYGRQVLRETSVVHKSRQVAGGFYWE